MGYYIDLEKISLDDYIKKLKKAYLPPSRMILKEKTEERLNYFRKFNIENVKELHQLLKKKEKHYNLINGDLITDNYLLILLRELNSIHPKPLRLIDFKIISVETGLKLDKIGVKNTLKLYKKILTKKDREILEKETGIKKSEIKKLTKLCDLSRIKWVGTTFAMMLYELGVDTVEKVAKTNPKDLHSKVNQLNKDKNIYKGQIGLNDIIIVIETAKDIPFEIEY